MGELDGCIFLWEILVDEKTRQNCISRIKRKLNEVSDDENGNIGKFVYSLALAIDVYRKDSANSRDVLKYLHECNMILEDSSKDLDKTYVRAAEYVIRTSIEFVSSGTSGDRPSAKIFSDDLSVEEQGAILGIKATVLLQYMCSKEALVFAKQAMNLNKKQGKWYYIARKCLLNRRQYGENIGDEEIQYLETACKLSKNVLYTLELVQAYQNKARSLRQKDFQKSKEYKQKSDKLLDISLVKGQEHSPVTYAKFAQELLFSFTLCDNPKQYDILKTVKDLIQNALLLSPENHFVNYVAGKCLQLEADYMMGIDKNIDDRRIAKNLVRRLQQKALEHYDNARKADLFEAELWTIGLKWKMDDQYDPTKDLLVLLDAERYPKAQAEVHCLLCYHYYQTGKTNKAIEELQKAVEVGGKVSMLKNFTFYYRGKRLHNINLFEMLCEKVVQDVQRFTESLMSIEWHCNETLGSDKNSLWEHLKKFMATIELTGKNENRRGNWRRQYNK